MKSRSKRAAAEAGKRITRPTDEPTRTWLPDLPAGPPRIRFEDLPAGSKLIDPDPEGELYELPDGTIAEINSGG